MSGKKGRSLIGGIIEFLIEFLPDVIVEFIEGIFD